jgi:thiamine biosynthesis lipoprotein
MKPPVPLPESHCFSHDAMHTTFTLRLYGGERSRLAGVARECFAKLDQLEERLSRFLEGSEISQINQLPAGETLYLSDDCHQCLLLAMQAYRETHGLFDITLGTRIERRKAGHAGPLPALTGKLVIHPDVPAITCETPGRELDLGGIGKGFALDQLKCLLLDWEVPGGLLAAGASTLLAFGPSPWPVELTAGDDPGRVTLLDHALSASGTDMQGSHIVAPWDDEETPDYLSQRVWVVAPTATMADAWSTALMLMSPAEAAACLPDCSAILHAYAELDGRIQTLK